MCATVLCAAAHGKPSTAYDIGFTSSVPRSDLVTNTNENGVPRWKQLCNAALAEFDPALLPQRIADARNAVLDQIEDNFSEPASDENQALRNALHALEALTALQTVVKRKTAQHEVGEQRKTGS